MQSSQPLGLLWPDGTGPSRAGTALDPRCVRDLELETTLAAFTGGIPRRFSNREVFLNLCTDRAVIAYRQDVLDDLWHNPDFAVQLEAAWSRHDVIRRTMERPVRIRSPLAHRWGAVTPVKLLSDMALAMIS
jgi:hypothetical protein